MEEQQQLYKIDNSDFYFKFNKKRNKKKQKYDSSKSSAGSDSDGDDEETEMTPSFKKNTKCNKSKKNYRGIMDYINN